jgi:hypothetical protein
MDSARGYGSDVRHTHEAEVLMADKRVLILNGTILTAFRWRKGIVTADRTFSSDPLGHETFLAYLEAAPSALIYVLADVSEEGFNLETIPAVQGSDRDALIKRRLGQFFFGTPYALGHSLGREKEGRRDERMLFAALTRPEVLTPWLALINQAQRPLAGVHSVPMVLAESVKNLVSGNDQFLLVTLASSGLRHTYFSDGQLQFSRLSQLNSHNQEEYVATCMRESARTHQYLLGQRLVARNFLLPTYILAHPRDHAKLRDGFEDTDKLSFELLDLDSVSKKAQFNTSLPDSHCDAFFVHQLVSKTPKAQYAPASDRKLFRLSQIRFGLQMAAAAVVFGCLVVSARLGLLWNETREKTAVIDAKAIADSRRHQALIDELPKIKLTPDNLRAVIARYDEILQRSAGATPLLVHLSTVLEEQPLVSLQRLEWALAERAAGSSPANAAPQPLGSPAPIAAAVITNTLAITATLPITMASDQRRQLEVVDEFAAKLKTEKINASIVQSPVDVGSGKALKRGSTETSRPNGPPEFKILLAMSAS